jgi:hypothetical protein
MYSINDIDKTYDILTNYFNKYEIDELDYYLNKEYTKSIKVFFQENIINDYDEDIINLYNKHFKLVEKKIFYRISPLNLVYKDVSISFITDLIYWMDSFTIKNTIFINYSYLCRVFENIKEKNYRNMDEVYINDGEIFDIQLLKQISYCIYSILQHYNFDSWIEKIIQKYGCSFIHLSNIEFNRKYNIVKNPSNDFLSEYITIYIFDGKIYGVINEICSAKSYSPYFEKIYLELEYQYNGKYKVINDLGGIEMNGIAEPFIDKAKIITDTIIHQNMI